jgi:hypothetical protein
MNVVYPESMVVVAKTCGCKERQKVTYEVAEESHKLCLDKKDILQAEIEACEKLLSYVRDESERAIVIKEIVDLKTALDLLP